MAHYVYMKKRSLRRAHRRSSVRKAHQPGEINLVVVRGWMLLVAFALMLGVGTIVGTYISQQLNAATPTVAGVTITR
jgi:hypothetical protein